MKYLLIFLFLFPILAFSADDADMENHKNATLDRMDESLDSFDEQTDDEAMEDMRQRIKQKKKDMDKKKKKKKEESKSVDHNSDPLNRNREQEDNNGLKDYKVNKDNTTEGSTSGYSNGVTDEGTSETQVVEVGDEELIFKMITFGSGYPLEGSGIEKSRHWGFEYGEYKEKSTFYKTGLVAGIGVSTLDNYEAYLSAAFSVFITPMNPDFGPFLRLDVGVMGFPYEKSSDSSSRSDDDVTLRYIGAVFKAGAGIWGSTGTNGLSLQMLYTVHMTTVGQNEGFELQVAYHF